MVCHSFSKVMKYIYFYTLGAEGYILTKRWGGGGKNKHCNVRESEEESPSLNRICGMCLSEQITPELRHEWQEEDSQWKSGAIQIEGTRAKALSLTIFEGQQEGH